MNKSVFTFIKEYALITLGILCFVVGWTVFLLPNNLIGGGVTGIASIIQYATGGVIKAGWSYFVVNLLLLVASPSAARPCMPSSWHPRDSTFSRA